MAATNVAAIKVSFFICNLSFVQWARIGLQRQGVLRRRKLARDFSTPACSPSAHKPGVHRSFTKCGKTVEFALEPPVTQTEGMNERLIVAITGASGAIYGVRLLERLRELPVETHLIATRWARVTIEHETDYSFAQVKELADVIHSEADQAAAVSSGSFLTRGMVIAPCSVKTLSAIATGFAHNLVCRAADVMLKEKRPLVLVVRETPLHTIHLRNMLTLSEMGVTIAPPAPAFYNRPGHVDDIVDHTVLRILDQFGFGLDAESRWQGLPGEQQS
jgi:4-hydroxy-3-polyprenylbenzoate decarboxylase